MARRLLEMQPLKDGAYCVVFIHIHHDENLVNHTPLLMHDFSHRLPSPCDIRPINSVTGVLTEIIDST